MTRPLSLAWHCLSATLAESPAPSLDLLDELDSSSTGTWQPVTYFGERIPPFAAGEPLPPSSTHSLVCALESASGQPTRDLGARPIVCAAASTSAAAARPTTSVPSHPPAQATRSADVVAAIYPDSDVRAVPGSADVRTTAAQLSGERRLGGSGDAHGGAL